MSEALAPIEPAQMQQSQLALAITAVMSEVDFVKKEGKNKDQGYTFVGEQHIIRALHDALVKHGLSIVPITIVNHAHETYLTKSGNTMHRTYTHNRYRLLHTSGEYLDLEMSGLGMDTSDKDGNKAHTQAYKYLMRQTFNIETGDADPDEATPEPTVPRDMKVLRREQYDPSKETFDCPPPQPAPTSAQKPASAPKPPPQGTKTRQRPCDDYGQLYALELVTIEAGSNKPTSTGKNRYSYKITEKNDWAGCFDTGMVEAALGDNPHHYKGQAYMRLFQSKGYWNFDWIQLEPPYDTLEELGPPLDMNNNPLSPGD